MWFELHRLLDLVQQFTEIDDEQAVDNLLTHLEKYKTKLQQICKNTPKSLQDRGLLKADADIKVDGTVFRLDETICAETRIISDIFNINELEALQLVLSGEAQLSNFSGLNRGLVAVICYYDMHRFLAEIMRIIVSWDKFSMTERLKVFIETNFAQLSVFKHLIELQGKFSVQSEFALLSQPEVNGLGGTRHQQVLRSLIEDICEATSECLYSICEWGADKSKEFASELYPILKAVPVAERFSSFHLAVWCSLIKLTSSEVLSQSASTSQTISEMIKEIRNETTWSDQSVCGTIQLACGVSIRAMAVNTVDHLNIANVDIDVERLVDRAVQNLALKFIRYGILATDLFKSCPAHLKIVDTLFKQLVSHFPAKLMEIERNSEDELVWVDQMAEKQQQVSPNGHFSTFLGCITDLYSIADWSKATVSVKESIAEMSIGYSSIGSMELCRFMERARIACHAVHSVAYLEFLRSVCRTKATAAFLFEIFARVPANHDTMFGWEQVMTALRSYERLFREHKQIAPHFGSQFAVAPQPSIPAQDLAGLISWINLAKSISLLDNEAALMFLEDRSWSLVDAAMGVIAAPVPLVLKGALFNLLSAISRKENAVQKIWASLQAYQICSFAENGALLGLQQELEERECVERRFDTSLGFVHLMKSLLQYNIPDIAAPYLQYLTKSIVSQMASRSYEDVQQMWELAEVSLDALLTILKRSYTDARAVALREPHVQLLVQILNDTPVYRAICTVLMEDCDVFLNPAPGGFSHRPSQKAARIAIELLSLACSRYNALRSAIRAANSDFLLATLQVLLLSPLRQTSDNVIDLSFVYLEQVDELPQHAMHAAQIINDLCLVRPSLQSKMVEQIRFRMRATGISSQIKAIRSVLSCPQIQFTVEDLLAKENVNLDPAWCRGETARLVLEFLSDSVQAEPKGPNLCFLLFGFQSPSSGQLYVDDTKRTGFHEVIQIIESFENDLPLQLPFSAIIEPAFRLLQNLVSVDCVYAFHVLRYLRSSDLINRLVSSPALTDCLTRYTASDDASTMFSLSRMIAGSVLHLCALEISYLLKNGHFEKPAELYRILLDSRNENIVDTDSANLLFSILQKSHISVNAEIEFPKLNHFNSQKLHQLFDDCKTKTVFGIIQTDVECLHALLKREISATQNDDVSYVEREMTAVLEYCTDLNSELLQRGSTSSLVSGCTALLNIVAVFSPVPFLSTVCQLDILTDASFILMEFASSCPSEPLVNVCDTIHRVCKAICLMSKEVHTELPELRTVIADLFTPLIELLVQPGEKPLLAKFSLYDAARLYLKTCYNSKEVENVPSSTEWLLDGNGPSFSSRDPFRISIDKFAYEISRRTATDIADLPVHLKIAPLLFLKDILHEDANNSKRVASFFSKTGMPRYMTELLNEIEIDWDLLSRKDVDHTLRYKLFITLLLSLIRLSLTEPGWNSLADLALPEVLSQLTALKNPPKQIFIQPATVNSKDTPSFLFANSVDLVCHLCLTMCAKPKWKRISLKILDVVHSHGEMLSQLMRAEIDCSAVETASNLVQQIYEDDEITRPAIDGEAVLRLLRQRKTGESRRQPLRENFSSFNAPSRLTRDMIIG